MSWAPTRPTRSRQEGGSSASRVIGGAREDDRSCAPSGSGACRPRVARGGQAATCGPLGVCARGPCRAFRRPDPVTSLSYLIPGFVTRFRLPLGDPRAASRSPPFFRTPAPARGSRADRLRESAPRSRPDTRSTASLARCGSPRPPLARRSRSRGLGGRTVARSSGHGRSHRLPRTGNGSAYFGDGSRERPG